MADPSRAGATRVVRLDQRTRLAIAASLGLVAWAATALFFPWQLSVLLAWDAAAIFVVASVWTFIATRGPDQTREVATREDDSRAVVDVIIVVASVISLVGVVIGLAHARHHPGAISSVLTTVAVATVFLSWFTVHTLFALRYAHLYYSDTPGGIDFPGKDDVTADRPDYLDFAYIAFTIGMTFQVSDTGITDRRIRRAILRQALLSYVFATVIVGVTINVVGNLIR